MHTQNHPFFKNFLKKFFRNKKAAYFPRNWGLKKPSPAIDLHLTLT